MVPIEVSRNKKSFNLVELYLKDGLNISGHLVVILEGETTWSLLIHIKVFKCMPL